MPVNTQNWKERFGRGAWEIFRRTVSIAGRVIDVQTGKSVSGAKVLAISDFKRLITSTGIDGRFHFLDLPEGTYKLIASQPFSGYRFETFQVEVTTFHDVEGNIKKLPKDEYKTNIRPVGWGEEEMTVGQGSSSKIGYLIIKLKP
jgi:hypothetical protein